VKFYRCDECRKDVETSPTSVFDAPWVVRKEEYRFGQNGEVHERHFCSLPCVAQWAQTHKDEDEL